MKMVMMDPQILAARKHAAIRIDLGRVDSEIHVREKRAEHDQAVATFDVTPCDGTSHRAFVDADVERMQLADDGFAEQRRADRNSMPLGERDDLLA